MNRIAELISQMTLREKLQQLTAFSPNGNRRLGIPNLRAGDRRDRSFPVGFERLKFRKDGRWLVESGTFTIWLGPDSVRGETIVWKWPQ